MAKPPADANPEHFVIGRGTYGNFRLAVPHDGASAFRIDPAPMPYVAIVVLNALFVAFFYGFHWVARRWASDAGVFFLYVVPIGIGVITCVGFTATAVAWFTIERRRGPWLVYDKATDRVSLPRLDVTRERGEIVHLQYVTTKRLDWGGIANNDRVSELNVVAMHDGKRERWPLLRSIATIGAFEYVLNPLVRSTGLPVVRIQDEWLGWGVKIAPYVPK